MDILISGGTGLLGHAVVKNFSQKHKLFILTTDVNQISTNNIQYISCDLSKDFDIKILPKKIDIIFHLAQSPLYKFFPEKSKNIFDININATHKLLEYGLNAQISHFIYSSSGSVYEPYHTNLTENSFVNPTSFYANSKLIGERLVKSYDQCFKTTIFRLFFLYGPHPQNKQTLINSLLNKLIANDPIIIEGQESGLIFSPTLTTDLARFFDLYLKNPKNGIYNLANPEPISLLAVVEALAQQLNLKPNLYWDKEKKAPIIIPKLDKFKDDFPEFQFTCFKESLDFLNYSLELS